MSPRPDPDTEINAMCYTYQGTKPCGRRVAAFLIIVPPGGQPGDAITDSRIGICMRHLIRLMHANGAGADEMADVVDGLATLLAKQIADEQRIAGRARPILSNVEPARAPEERS